MSIANAKLSLTVGNVITFAVVVASAAGTFYGVQYAQSKTDASQDQALSDAKTAQLATDTAQDIQALNVKAKQIELDAAQNALIAQVQRDLNNFKGEVSKGFKKTHSKLDENGKTMKEVKEQMGDFEQNVQEVWGLGSPPAE